MGSQAGSPRRIATAPPSAKGRSPRERSNASRSCGQTTGRYQSQEQHRNGSYLDTVANQMDEDPIHFRARCLLQTAGSVITVCPRSVSVLTSRLQGFLDIDKLIEYRDPVEQFNLWKRGKVPQCKCSWCRTGLISLIQFLVKVDHVKENGTPVLILVRCAILSCRNILRGAFFRCSQVECRETSRLEAGDYVCEDCFRAHRHPRHHLVKVHKHCKSLHLEGWIGSQCVVPTTPSVNLVPSLWPFSFLACPLRTFVWQGPVHPRSLRQAAVLTTLIQEGGSF